MNLADINVSKLIEGLEYLKRSRFDSECDAENIDIFYGSKDNIVKRSEIDNCLKVSKKAEFFEFDFPHYFDENTLLNYVDL